MQLLGGLFENSLPFLVPFKEFSNLKAKVSLACRCKFIISMSNTLVRFMVRVEVLVSTILLVFPCLRLNYCEIK